MPLTAHHPDSPGTRVHLTKRPRLLVFSVDRHTGSVQLLPILWPNMCLEHTATEVATEFQDAVTVRRSENRAVVRPLPLGAINVGAGGFLFFSARSPLRKLPSAPPPPPQSRPSKLAAPETFNAPEENDRGRAPCPAPPFLHRASSPSRHHREFSFSPVMANSRSSYATGNSHLFLVDLSAY